MFSHTLKTHHPFLFVLFCRMDVRSKSSFITPQSRYRSWREIIVYSIEQCMTWAATKDIDSSSSEWGCLCELDPLWLIEWIHSVSILLSGFFVCPRAVSKWFAVMWRKYMAGLPLKLPFCFVLSILLQAIMTGLSGKSRPTPPLPPPSESDLYCKSLQGMGKVFFRRYFIHK